MDVNLSKTQAATIFNKFHVIFIKMTGFLLNKYSGSCIKFIHILIWTTIINNIYDIFLIDVTLKLCDFHSSTPFKLTLKYEIFKNYSTVKPQTSNKLSIYNIMDVKVQASNACEVIY